MKHKIEIAPNLAIYIDGERVIGSKPYGLFLTTEMIVSDEDLKRLSDRCFEVISDRKTENCSEIPNNCEDKPQKSCSTCGYSPQTPSCDTCEGYSNWWLLENEPQIIRCPKCGRSDYIREFGKDFNVTAEEAGFKYKCINCNTYIEPQTERSK